MSAVARKWHVKMTKKHGELLRLFVASRRDKQTPPVGVWFLFWNNFFNHGTGFGTMAILVKALKCATEQLHAFP